MDDAILSFTSPTSAFEMRNFVEMIRILVTMNQHEHSLPLTRVSSGSDGRTCNFHFPLVSSTLLEWINRESHINAAQQSAGGGGATAGAGAAAGSPSNTVCGHSLKERLQIAHQIVSTMEFSHQKGIAHRYLTSAAILMKGSDTYIAGFETARAAASADLNYICPRNYRPPEVILSLGRVSEGAEPLEQVDAWSVGCLLFEIATLQPLFSLVSSKDDNGAIKPVLVKQQLTDIIKVIGSPSEEECQLLGCNPRHTSFLKGLNAPRTLEALVVEKMIEVDPQTPVEVAEQWGAAIGQCLRFVNSQRISLKDLASTELFKGLRESGGAGVGALKETTSGQQQGGGGFDRPRVSNSEEASALVKAYLEELGLSMDEELLE